MLLTILYVVGITAEGMTGALAAGRQKMDLFGVLMIAEMTALGGGTIRDIVLGHYPLTWVRTPEYLLLVAVAAILSVMIHPVMQYFRKVFLTLDAVGLAVFSVLGIHVALEMGHGFVIAVVAAVVTGVFGGILRDVFCNRIPLVFRAELYASAVLLGVVTYWLLMRAGVDTQVTTVATLAVVFTVRMLALRFRWSLPVFEYQEREYRRQTRTQIWATARMADIRQLARRRGAMHRGRGGSPRGRGSHRAGPGWNANGSDPGAATGPAAGTGAD